MGTVVWVDSGGGSELGSTVGSRGAGEDLRARARGEDCSGEFREAATKFR